MLGSFDQPLFAFGLTTDPWGLGALVCALLVAVTPWPHRFSERSSTIVTLLAVIAGVLSWCYRAHFLGGASRVIDATTYLLQARQLADGGFCGPVMGPTASYRGRFVLESLSDPGCIGGIFPPGYPALLSLGVKFGAPELIGAVLAAATVWMTAHWARQVHRSPQVMVVAALFSAFCVNLRYQTADTMSHGLSIFLTLVMLSSTTRLMQSLSQPARHRAWGVFGLAAGWLLATRQWTCVLVGLACGAAFLGVRGRRHLDAVGLLWGLIGALPGLALLAAQQDALTGNLFHSPQLAYYARADGPAGCFGIGWGKGCHYEHADVVADQGGSGLTWQWSLLNAVHRLHWHSLDVAHFEPLLLVAAWGAWRLRCRPAAWPGLLLLLTLPLGYSLFYFNGSYPGGGARFLSEMLPVLHVTLAGALVRLRAVRVGLLASALGFATHAWVSHAALARPHFGPEPRGLDRALERLDAESALQEPAARRTNSDEHAHPTALFVSTAHDFNLGHRRRPGVLVVRETHDARGDWIDRRFGASFHRTLLPDGQLVSRPVAALADEPWVLETEFDFPIRDIQGAWVHPEYLPLSCVSRGAALAVKDPVPGAVLSLELLGPDAVAEGDRRVLVHYVTADEERGAVCSQWDAGVHALSGPLLLELDELPGVTHIDHLELTAPHD